MELKIIHFYPDLMSLYGSYANVSVLRRYLEALGCADPREAVLLGDSLSADIGCARAAGIDSIWLAPAGQSSPLPTWIAHSLAEAERILLP